MNDADSVQAALAAALRSGSAVARCTVVASEVEEIEVAAELAVRPGADVVGARGDAELDRVVARDAEGLVRQGLTERRHYGPHGEARRADVTVFIECHAPAPRLVVFGAVDFSRALVQVGSVLGYHTTVCDPRPAFSTTDRFPEADEVVVDWPDRYLDRQELDERSVICVLTHDPKMDVPALQAAVRTSAGYIGAMGSRRTTEERRRRLVEMGMDAGQLARIHAPIGLDIGPTTAEETALAILAEVVALRSGRSGRPLRDGDGPIH